jgi:N-acetylglucosaminyl-diphospho-decaprenol L-rhamnosyltransferase
MKKRNKDITVILTLYKTPTKKLINLNEYRNFKIILFNQNSNTFYKKELKQILNFKFLYYSSKKNIGLSKSSNFLLKKVKTKYCLFTQADVNISEKSINLLKKILIKKKDTIFIGPNFKKINSKDKLKKYSYVKNLDIACMLCDVKKLKKINFFDEDFFLYWEDIFLINKINRSKYKMIIANNVKAYHEGGKSTKDDLKTQFIRNSNFKYGEFLYDYKLDNFRYLKLIRQFFQNIFYLIFNFLSFNKNNLYKNLAIITGIYKFSRFYLFKKVSSLLNK